MGLFFFSLQEKQATVDEKEENCFGRKTVHVSVHSLPRGAGGRGHLSRSSTVRLTSYSEKEEKKNKI